MGRFFKFGSRLVLEILPSIAATVIGGYLLTQLHFGHTTEPAAPPQAAAAPAQASAQTPAQTTPSDVPTVREDRAAMREVLKERRENPEAPAVVRPVVAAAPVPPPTPATVPASPSAPVTAQLPAAMDSIPVNEPIEHAATASRPNVVAAPVTLPRARPEPVASVYAPAPPPGLPQAPALGMDTPMQVAPATAPAGPAVAGPAQTPVTAEAPPRRGVFSAISSIVGGAASATGNTVNWVIDLPGKAIDAGGRVIGITPPPPNRPFS
jgi:hypothetical protein